MNEREKFEAWAEENGSFDNVMALCEWKAWQACAAEKDKELAALQARVKELEDSMEDICGDKCNAEYNPCRARQVLSTTPDQALQRALLDVLLAEYEAQGGDPRREKELRAQRAELGERDEYGNAVCVP